MKCTIGLREQRGGPFPNEGGVCFWCESLVWLARDISFGSFGFPVFFVHSQSAIVISITYKLRFVATVLFVDFYNLFMFANIYPFAMLLG